MADFEPFAGLSQEDTSAMLLLVLTAILDKMPRIDTADRLVISGSEVENLVALQVVGSSGRARPTDLFNLAIPNMGALHIYNQIEVS